MLKGPEVQTQVQQEFGVQPPEEEGFLFLEARFGGCCWGLGNAARSQRLPLLPSSALHGFAIFSPD